MPDKDYPAIAVVGPTASGKTAVGTALAERFRGEIVVCDALQVYRHLDIGTAKPTAEQRSEIPHHMIDLREPYDDFTAGDYLRLGREALHGVRSRGNVPIVVGGSGFYLRALIEGLFEGPGRSAELRARMRRIAAKRGTVSIHRALRRVDPQAAARLAPADLERNIRAYEIYLLTHRTMTEWQEQPRDKLVGFRWLKLGIQWERPRLYQRINERVEEMFRSGFVDEVRSLMSGYSPTCHAFKSIGYRQISDCLERQGDMDQAKEDIQRESRRYAKRQTTWFRADADIVWLDAGNGFDSLLERACAVVSRFLDWTAGNAADN